MNKEKKFEFKVSCGITSIIMIFVVLSLTAFGVLSYTAANSDKKMSKKNAKSIEDYYLAEGEIMEKICKIDNICHSVKSTENGKNFNAELKEALKGKVNVESYDEETRELVLKEYIGEKRYLLVRMTLYDKDSEKNYEITEYRTIRE